MHLMELYPGHNSNKHLRSLQRRIYDWNAQHGEDKTIIFPQDILPVSITN